MRKTLSRLVDKFKGIHFVVPRTWADLQHKSEHFFHMSYLGFTAYEGHGWHASSAGVLLIVVILGIFVHTEH